jgi:long-chain acyl-CoA synthetase
MELNKYNNLLELFNFQFNRQDSKNILLRSLKNVKNSFTWQQTFDCVQKLSDELNANIEENDRCLLISENRPEWLISDLAIMLAKGITVPAYTTYTERDYEYLINDCKPSVIIVSEQSQYDKIVALIKKNNFIKLIITFDDIKSDYKNIININKIFKKKIIQKKT